MAIRFSHVILMSQYGVSELLASGRITESGQLNGYSIYEDYCVDIDEDTTIDVQVYEYQYGDGDVANATIPEIAYLSMEASDNPNFLKEHCNYIGKTSFEIEYCPEELFGIDFLNS